MPRNRDPTQNKLNSIFGSPLSYSVEFWSIFLKTTFKNLLCYVYIIASSFMFLWSPCVYMNMYVSVSTCVSCAFPCLGVLSYSYLFGFLSSYSFIIISWIPVCFLIRYKKSIGQDGKKGVKELEGVMGGEIRIHCMKKSLWKMP